MESEAACGRQGMTGGGDDGKTVSLRLRKGFCEFTDVAFSGRACCFLSYDASWNSERVERERKLELCSITQFAD